MAQQNGRPAKYNEQLAIEICDTIARTPLGLRTIIKQNPTFPGVDTIFSWMSKYPEFETRYREAKQKQVDALTEDILEISKESKGGTSEDIASARLQIETNKWFATKLVPKIYGDRVHHNAEIKISYSEQLKKLDE